MKETTVVHVRSEAWKQAWREGRAVYIGRNCPAFCGSPFGNPFKIGAKRLNAEWIKKELTRNDVIEMYRQWACGERAHPNCLKFPHELLEELRGKVLGCWCKPNACHGDVLVELLKQSEAA